MRPPRRERAGDAHVGSVLAGVKAPHRTRPLRASALTPAPRGTTEHLSPALSPQALWLSHVTHRFCGGGELTMEPSASFTGATTRRRTTPAAEQTARLKTHHHLAAAGVRS